MSRQLKISGTRRALVGVVALSRVIPGSELVRLSALYKTGILDTAPDPAYDAILDDLLHRIDVPLAQINFVDLNRIWAKAAVGNVGHENPRRGTMCATVAESEPMLVVPDARADLRFENGFFVSCPPYVRAFAGVGLRTPDEQTIGVVCVADIRPRVFDGDELAALQATGATLTETLDRRRMSRLDAATGALDRRSFLEQVRRMTLLTTSLRRGVSLIVIDVDPFHSMLEQLKTDLGRIMVERVAGLGRGEVRRLDSFGRLDENTFGLLLPETDEAGARVLAQRLTERLAEGWAALIPASGPAPVAVGVAALQSGVDTADALLARAEAARNLTWPGTTGPVSRIKVA